MRKITGLLLIISVLAACNNKKTIIISVSNTSSLERTNELAEIEAESISAILGDESFVITDHKGNQVPYQITYDKKIIFPVTLQEHALANYYVEAGKPNNYTTIACGKHYPERLDDIAWENDKIAFRTYGPALQATGERAFGYDIWVKRVSEPVVEKRYATELNPETKAKIEEVRKTDKEAAQALAHSVSYHIDHGNGLDFYSVGPTLGAGTSALLSGDTIIYPYCYKTYEILDNGPLRFTVKLTYNPFVVGDDPNVIETRIISLDAGSQLNKITLSFANLSKTTPIATGIVMHEPSNEYQINKETGYIAYAEHNDPENGQIYVGVAFPTPIHDANIFKFSDKEKKERNASGHVLAITDYPPGSNYTYYAGGGWSRWGFANAISWYNDMNNFARKIKNPLHIVIQ
ncbi:MAG: DUF4861 domain-containing protein [Tannerellaceae bacterium]|jgi:hypothetical protein|nr:DUF4861 domain-containing protein [Tannerellaceae bacterium]